MICAIDPNTKKLAFVVAEPTAKAGAFFPGEFPLGDPNEDLVRLQTWFRALKAFGVTHVAYELPYLGKNVKSFQRLTEVKALVEAAARGEGLKFIEVNPSQWQAACLSVGKGRGTRGQKREFIKPLSVAYAKDVLGAAPGTEDLADATCIHQHVAKNVIPAMEGAA